MLIRLEQVTASPSALHLGCVIEGPKRAWVRFAVVSVPYEMIPYSAVARMVNARLHDVGDDGGDLEPDEPLF